MDPKPYNFRHIIKGVLDQDETIESITKRIEETIARKLEIHVSEHSLNATQSVSQKLIEHFHRYPNDLKTMNRRGFEELVAELWDGFGYEVELTKRTRDGGCDIIAVRNTLHKEKLLIECKRPDPGNKIGIGLVRQLYGVKNLEGASKAILATTSYFTRDVKAVFKKVEYELEGKDFDGIQDWLTAYLIEKGVISPNP